MAPFVYFNFIKNKCILRDEIIYKYVSSDIGYVLWILMLNYLFNDLKWFMLINWTGAETSRGDGEM